MIKTYQIDGMHCAACIGKIEAALKDFADTVTVTLHPPRAILTGEKIANLDELNAAIAKVGSYKLKAVEYSAPALALSDEPQASWVKTYYPLFLIIGMISAVSFSGAENAHEWMINFMAGFFLVFGAFKLLDINGFRDAYSTYDLLAKRWANYGLIYPFLELGLGFAFLFQFEVITAFWLSFILMSFSSLGVIQAVMQKRKIQCACLGTVLKLPMSTITLVEDLGMAAMALIMIFGGNIL